MDVNEHERLFFFIIILLRWQ